jgi:hypothetical protein
VASPLPVLTGRGRVRGGASCRRRFGQSPGPLTSPLPAKRRGEEFRRVI